MVDERKRLKRADACAFQTVADKVVVVHPRSRMIHELNPTAGFLWYLLEEGLTVDDMAQRMCEEFEVSLETARDDVRAFGDAMLKSGLLETA